MCVPDVLDAEATRSPYVFDTDGGFTIIRRADGESCWLPEFGRSLGIAGASYKGYRGFRAETASVEVQYRWNGERYAALSGNAP